MIILDHYLNVLFKIMASHDTIYMVIIIMLGQVMLQQILGVCQEFICTKTPKN